MWHLPTGQPYLDLQAILADKDCFVLTTNVDGQCRRVFPQERLCEYQGNMGYFSVPSLATSIFTKTGTPLKP